MGTKLHSAQIVDYGIHTHAYTHTSQVQLATMEKLMEKGAIASIDC